MIQGVPLTGGQAVGLVGGASPPAASRTSPPAFGNIITVNVPPGTYTVSWTVALSGTVAAADANNFELTNGGVFVANSVNAGTAGSYPQASQVVTVTAGNPFVQVIAGAATPTTGAIYTATVVVAPVPNVATLTVGPQGLGNVWYPVQCTISSSVGAADNSTVAVYLGSQAQQNLQGGQSYAGGGDVVALSVAAMTPGDLLIAVWSNPTPGSTIAFNILGTMDALGA
jgi:hypothetical protein